MKLKPDQKIEISHDILAREVYSRIDAEDKMRLKVTQFLQDRYEYHLESGVLLDKDDLEYIAPFVDRIDLLEEHEALIQKSKAAESRRVRRRNIQIIGIGVVLLIATLFSFAAAQNAQANAALAKVAQEKAEQEKAIAEEALGKAEVALNLADRYQTIREKVVSRVLISDKSLTNAPPDILSLGIYDQNVPLNEIEDYIMLWHKDLLMGQLPDIQKLAFRGQDLQWKPLTPARSKQSTVLYLQLFLVDAGFLKPEAISGFFEYETQSAIRQFQENLMLAGVDIIPDGTAGLNTWFAISDWKKAGRVSPYNQFSTQLPSPDYQKWMQLLDTIRTENLASPTLVQQQIEQHPNRGDTRKLEDWDLSPDSIHLLGIRRRANIKESARPNDDLFILLIKGQSFKFWGSLDPNYRQANRPDPAFMASGQHEFKFGWQQRSNPDRSYRGLIPKSDGVLYYRDTNRDSIFNQADIAFGLQEEPNFLLSLGYTSNRSSFGTWSGGQPMICGESYVNYGGDLISYPELIGGTVELSDHEKTRGAYYTFLDLVNTLSKDPDPTVFFSIIDEEAVIQHNMDKELEDLIQLFELVR